MTEIYDWPFGEDMFRHPIDTTDTDLLFPFALDADITCLETLDMDELLGQPMPTPGSWLTSANVAAAFRLAVVYYDHRGWLSAKHITDCPAKMTMQVMDADQVAVLKSYFGQIQSVVFGDDVGVDFGNGAVNHHAVFGVKVPKFSDLIEEYSDGQLDTMSGQLHMIKSGHPFAREGWLPFVFTNLPGGYERIHRSHIRLDQIVVGYTPSEQRRRPNVPKRDVEALFKNPECCSKIPSFASPPLAKTAYRTLVDGVYRQPIENTVLESAMQFARQVGEPTTPEQHWKFITDFFHVLYSYHNKTAQVTWEMFILAVLDNARFTLVCAEIGVIENHSATFGTAVEWVETDLVNQYKVQLENQVTKLVVGPTGKLKACNPEVRHFMVPTNFMQLEVTDQPVGKAFGGYDLDVLVQLYRTKTPTKKKPTKKKLSLILSSSIAAPAAPAAPPKKRSNN